VAVDAGADPFLRACRRLPAPHTPVWFMRQAGRSLPEYRRLRERHAFDDLIRRPDLAAEVTLQPVRRLHTDAAILFSDIITPVQAIVGGITIHPGRGPVIERPFRSKEDLGRLRPLEPESDIPFVTETVRVLSSALEVPLIGFAGAPFTVASYLVEGGRSKEYATTKALMRSEPALWAALLDELADVAVASLRAQVEAGASAVQLFDSWVGTLSAADYRRYVLPASARVLAGLADLGVPRIHFGVGTGELLALMASAGADVVGVDWRLPLDEARRRLGTGVAVQGNLDPSAVLCPWAVVEEEVDAVLAAGGGVGHVFNLGWGVFPETDPGVLARVVDHVHQATATG
jgi:uroporphyrinogen decarboxylase